MNRRLVLLLFVEHSKQGVPSMIHILVSSSFFEHPNKEFNESQVFFFCFEHDIQTRSSFNESQTCFSFYLNIQTRSSFNESHIFL